MKPLELGPSGFVGLLLFGALVVVATAMLLIGLPGGVDEEAPRLDFVENQTRNQVDINATLEGIAWEAFQLRLGQSGGYWFEGEDDLTRVDEMVFTQIENDTMVEKGDRIRFCLDDDTGPYEVVLRHIGTDQIVAVWSFQEAVACNERNEGPSGDQEGPGRPEGAGR